MAAPLDLDLLRTFVTVIETGSLSAAAPRVGRSQSAVSMPMQRLDQAVGNQPLIRNPRSVRPNPAGESVLNSARRLPPLPDAAWATFPRPEETGSVRLGVPDDYAAFLLPPVLSRFAEEHPLVTVELVCEQSTSLVKAIDEDRVNLAIVTRGATQPLEVIRRERLIWVASPTHVAWENDPLPIALFEPGCAARMNVLDALGDADRSYRCTYSSASLLGLIAVVQAGLAVAALAACSVPSTLRVIGENEGLPPLRDLEIGIMRSPVSSSPAIDRLNDFLRRELAQIA